MEEGLDGLYAEKFGEAQYLDPFARDRSAIRYEEKLKKYLETVLISDETAKRVRRAFDAYIFLSYRKKDRHLANELMKRIHSYPEFRDIAIWYDEFLTPGEHFNDSIQTAFDESDLFVMAVTPSLLEPSPDAQGKMQDNYIVRIEYPMAKASGKPILPVEMVPTDRNSLELKYESLPHCTNHRDAAALAQALAQHLVRLSPERPVRSPEHDFLIGLAYLRGIETEADHEKALPLIRNAAQQGMAEAAQMLVTMYAEGMGVARSLDMTAKWQAHLIELRQEKFDSAPSQETGLALLEDIDALMHLHEDTGDTHTFLNLTLRLRDTAASVMEVAPCVEVFRYISVAMTTLGQYYFQTEDYASALLCCQQSLTKQGQHLPYLAKNTVNGT
jgi:TPR repeat protein